MQKEDCNVINQRSEPLDHFDQENTTEGNVYQRKPESMLCQSHFGVERMNISNFCGT